MDESQEFELLLQDGASRMGMALSGDGIKKLAIHHELLCRWADKTNLTTIRDPVGMVERLYLDSAVLMDQFSPGVSVHDVGTGAGFPGLVLCSLRPDLQVTLTEARRKKVSFLKTAVRQMKLPKDRPVIRWSRLGWEENPDPEERWDEVVSRATFPPEEWIRIGWPLVKAGGRLWIMAAPHEPSEQHPSWLAKEKLPLEIEHAATVSYRLPFSGIERFLIALRRPIP